MREVHAGPVDQQLLIITLPVKNSFPKARLKSILYCLSALLAGTGTYDGYLHSPTQPQKGEHWSKGGDCEVYMCMQCINANMLLLSRLRRLL